MRLRGHSPARQPSAISNVENEDLYEMANLYPDTTGLPMTVWVSPRGNARHDVRIKVNLTHGERMDITNTAIVAVRPAPRVLAGNRRRPMRRRYSSGMALNADAVTYWDGNFYRRC